MSRRLLLLFLAGVFALPPSMGSAGETESSEEARPATISVSGVGFFKRRQLRETLQLLQPEERPITQVDAALVEDGVVLLKSALEQEGFLRPSGTVIVRNGDEEVGRFPWDVHGFPSPPRDLAGSAAEFMIEPGVRYYFDRIGFEGLHFISEEQARGFFIETGFILEGTRGRKFTSANLSRGVSNLREFLARNGLAEAQVAGDEPEIDHETGAVEVTVRVEEGPLHFVGRIDLVESDLPDALAGAIAGATREEEGALWSRLWIQDFEQEIRTEGFERGYPEIQAELRESGRRQGEAGVVVDSELRVRTGPKVHVGRVFFEGERRVSHSVLERTTNVKSGSLFVRSAIDEDRLRLGALGVFTSVRVKVARQDPETWDLTYAFTPSKRVELSLLAGYGSYEQFRGGLELFHANALGRAHRGRLQLIQSMKSTSGDYLYSIPQVFGTVTDASFRVFGLRREEVSFDREEIGSSVGLRRRVRAIDADAALRYQFESVKADITGDLDPEDRPTDSRVASVTFDLTHDRRDNPLTPRRGRYLSLTLESADRWIGGEVDYQRFDFRAAWHTEVGRGRWLHLGARHGVLTQIGGSGTEIPFAKRFFPGGENTVRGYREGRASPRNEEGLVVGAEVMTVVNLELEQALTESFSVVVFSDIGVTGERLESWPGKEVRISVGLGLRYNTIIGPARLEYGHNVVKESGDQIGELHFALGYPF